MKVAILGAGFTGLTAGYYLSKKGIDITILEKEKISGGLASGFRENGWKWFLEKHYHHVFQNDNSFINLAKELDQKIVFSSTKSSTYYSDGIFQLDNPISLLKFTKLSFIDRFRTGVVIAYLKIYPFWKSLENITAKKFIQKYMGNNSWKVIWEPLFIGKFGDKSDKVTASWFWARIYKRSKLLGYPEGGFSRLTEKLVKHVTKNKGEIKYSSSVKKVIQKNNKFIVETNSGLKEEFDLVISTLPNYLNKKVISKFPIVKPVNSLGAVDLVLVLKNRFFNEDTYWLNVNQRDFPFLAVVEHTNYISSKYYSGENILYVGNYLPREHKYFKLSESDLVKEFTPYLQKINPSFKSNWIKKSRVFKEEFAQPIFPKNYSKEMLPIKLLNQNIFIANMEQVYPWDRGTNYAVELGKKVADMVSRVQIS